MKILNFTSLKNHDVFEFSYACNYDIVKFFLNIDSWLDSNNNDFFWILGIKDSKILL